MVTDMAKTSAAEATATKARKVDEQRKAAAIKRKEMSDASFLRQPGKGTEVEEKDEDKVRFTEPLAQLMMAKVLRDGRPCGMCFHGAHNCRNKRWSNDETVAPVRGRTLGGNPS